MDGRRCASAVRPGRSGSECDMKIPWPRATPSNQVQYVRRRFWVSHHSGQESRLHDPAGSSPSRATLLNARPSRPPHARQGVPTPDRHISRLTAAGIRLVTIVAGNVLGLSVRAQFSLMWTATRCLTSCVLTDSEAELSAQWGCRRHGRARGRDGRRYLPRARPARRRESAGSLRKD